MAALSESLFMSNLANFLFGVGQIDESNEFATRFGKLGSGLSQSLAIQRQAEKAKAIEDSAKKRKMFTSFISSGVSALGSLAGGKGGGGIGGGAGGGLGGLMGGGGGGGGSGMEAFSQIIDLFSNKFGKGSKSNQLNTNVQVIRQGKGLQLPASFGGPQLKRPSSWGAPGPATFRIPSSFGGGRSGVSIPASFGGGVTKP